MSEVSTKKYILTVTETGLCDYNNTIQNFSGYSHVHRFRGKNKVGVVY